MSFNKQTVKLWYIHTKEYYLLSNTKEMNY